MTDTAKFIEICRKYNLQDIYGDGEYFGIDNVPMFSCDDGIYLGTRVECLEYDETGFYLNLELDEILNFKKSIEKFEKNIIACIKKYKKVKKEYKIKIIGEL